MEQLPNLKKTTVYSARANIMRQATSGSSQDVRRHLRREPRLPFLREVHVARLREQLLRKEANCP